MMVDDDALYEQAVAVVCQRRRASISLVQRHLHIGFNRAARLLKRMELDGVVPATDSKRRSLTQQQLKELLEYDPATGEFTRKHGRTDRSPGSICDGYLKISLAGHGLFRAHRLAWLYVYGVMPEMDIDHINGDRLDNRIANLRDVPGVSNSQNLRKSMLTNKSGMLGVSRRRGTYRAKICVDGKAIHLGTFKTAEEAHATYLAAKRAMHPACTI